MQLLALHDGVIHRDRLAAELWPDDPPWIGQQRLRNVLSRLRRHMGGLVVRERRRDLITLAQHARIDVQQFLAASSEATRLARSHPQAALEQGTQPCCSTEDHSSPNRPTPPGPTPRAS